MPIAVAAARAGKHVFCEKPIAMNADEARQMLDAAREAGVRHMVAFNYRRVPAIALAVQLIEEGKIGEIRHFNAAYYQDWLVDPSGVTTPRRLVRVPTVT
jgi:predicted dehydrogenase